MIRLHCVWCLCCASCLLRSTASVLIQRLPADLEFTCQLRLVRALRTRPFLQLGDLLRSQGRLAARVFSGCLRDGDALALPFPEERAFELSERTHHGEQQFAHRIGLLGECEAFLDEL